jgi:hypothetical protein
MTISKNIVVQQAQEDLREVVELVAFYHTYVDNEFSDEVYHKLCKEVVGARAALRRVIEIAFKDLS